MFPLRWLHPKPTVINNTFLLTSKHFGWKPVAAHGWLQLRVSEHSRTRHRAVVQRSWTWCSHPGTVAACCWSCAALHRPGFRNSFDASTVCAVLQKHLEMFCSLVPLLVQKKNVQWRASRETSIPASLQAITYGRVTVKKWAHPHYGVVFG